MEFKIFGMTVIIRKDEQTWLNGRKHSSEELIGSELNSDRQMVHIVDPVIADCAWKTVYDEFFSHNGFTKSIIPPIKRFRDTYAQLRGICPTLRVSKEYVESKTVKLDTNNYAIKSVIKRGSRKYA